MNSMPSYRDFAAAGAPGYRPGGRPAPARRGFLSRVLDAIALSHQRAAEREIARVVGGCLGDADVRLTDEAERRLFEHLTGNRGFHP
jgi:hypothetical protein